MKIKNYNIPLSQQDITEQEISAVNDVLRSNALSLGPKLPEFEEKVAKFVGVKHAIAVNSGTSGLHLCVRSLGIKDDDEVITTPFSFIASANCILFDRAKPVFVDIDKTTLNIDVTKIEAAITQRTKAILPVHVFGLPADMSAIMKIAKKHNLHVIEDSCEAIGATIDGVQAGAIADCGTFAFYPNKQMTTGEGGIIVTDNDNIDKLAKSMRNQGRDEGMGWLAHTRLGYNYRISDINCALGVVQIERINEILAARDNVAKIYKKVLSKKMPEIILPCENSNGLIRSWFVYVVQLPHNYSEEQRNSIINYLRKRGIGCNCYFPPIHLQPFYKNLFGYKEGDFPITECVSKRSIALPFFNKLSEENIQIVVQELKNAIAQ